MHGALLALACALLVRLPVNDTPHPTAGFRDPCR